MAAARSAFDCRTSGDRLEGGMTKDDLESVAQALGPTPLIDRCADWIAVMVESDDFGATHWCRDLAGVLAAAPVGMLPYGPSAYRPRPPAYPLEAEGSTAQYRRLPWRLDVVVEHGLLAWVHTLVVEGAEISPRALHDLEAVRRHLPSLSEEIDTLLASVETPWAGEEDTP